MKKYFKYCLLLLCCFSATKLFAQQEDITGVWNGELQMIDTAGEMVHLPYEIAVSEEKGKLVGYSRIVFNANGKEEAGIRDITLKWKGPDLIIEDEDFLEHHFSIHTPKRVKKTMTMQLTVTEKEMILEGSWETNKVRYYVPAKGTAVLKRRKDFKKSELFKRLDTLNIAAKLSFKDRPSIDEPVTVAAVSKPIEKKPEPVAVAPIPEPEIDLMVPAIAKATATTLPISKRRIQSTARITGFSKQKKVQMDLLAKSTLKPAPPKSQPVDVAVNDKPEKKPAISEPRQKPEPKPKPQPETSVAKPVEKKPETKAEPVVVKPAPKPVLQPTLVTVPSATQGAAEIDKRVSKTDQAYYFESDSLVLTLYDNGEVDGDTVTVLMNGGVLFSKVGLSTKPNTKTVYITSNLDSVKLVMYAESLGEIPPNTGLLIINDGDKRYDVRFSADLNTNAAIVLRRRKNN